MIYLSKSSNMSTDFASEDTSTSEDSCSCFIDSMNEALCDLDLDDNAHVVDKINIKISYNKKSKFLNHRHINNISQNYLS